MHGKENQMSAQFSFLLLLLFLVGRLYLRLLFVVVVVGGSLWLILVARG